MTSYPEGEYIVNIITVNCFPGNNDIVSLTMSKDCSSNLLTWENHSDTEEQSSTVRDFNKNDKSHSKQSIEHKMFPMSGL